MSRINSIDCFAPESKVRLLFVDDQASQRRCFSNALSEEGYEVLTAQDGLEALARLVAPLPNLIISDLSMPRMSGYEFLEIVRQKFPKVPTLAISGEFEGLEMPTGVVADAYLPKGGFTFEQLRNKIKELLLAPPRNRYSRARECNGTRLSHKTA